MGGKVEVPMEFKIQLSYDDGKECPSHIEGRTKRRWSRRV